MLQRENRLLRRSDFGRVYRRGQSKPEPCFVLYRRRRQPGPARIGFSVSKKLGDAVVRNRVKRRFRHAVRAELAAFRPGFDYVFVVRSAAVEREFSALRRDVAKAAAAQPGPKSPVGKPQKGQAQL